MLIFMSRIVAQHVLSLPGLRRLQQPIRKWITGSVRVTSTTFQQRVDLALMYLSCCEKAQLGNFVKSGDTILDHGAGWHLTVPLLYYRLGAKRQILTDVLRLVEPALVFHIARELNRLQLDGKCQRPLPEPGDLTFDQWLAELGISFIAPAFLPIPVADASIGAILSTGVLCYPTREEIRFTFQEVARALKPGGVFVCSVPLFDIYSLYDTSLSRFNFLRYSKKTWDRWFRTSTLSLNRLRVSDFLAALHELPLDPVIWEPTPPSDTDLQALDRIPLHSDFANYARDDLACPYLFFVLRKR